MFANALKAQDKKNEDAGLSMSELMAKKRAQTEKQIEESKGKPTNTEVEDRKARLIAQRDVLRKAKEAKR